MCRAHYPTACRCACLAGRFPLRGTNPGCQRPRAAFGPLRMLLEVNSVPVVLSKPRLPCVSLREIVRRAFSALVGGLLVTLEPSFFTSDGARLEICAEGVPIPTSPSPCPAAAASGPPGPSAHTPLPGGEPPATESPLPAALGPAPPKNLPLSLQPAPAEPGPCGRSRRHTKSVQALSFCSP